MRGTGFMTGFVAVLVSLVAAASEPPTLAVLKARADEVLAEDNVSARDDVDVVFEFADALLKANRNAEAEKYLVQGLRHYPWRLEYQARLAELLAESGRRDKAAEKASLVLEHAETDALRERAATLLGKPNLPAFAPAAAIPGTNCCVVLVPLGGCDRWLISRIRGELEGVLGIPVYIRTIDLTLPPCSRDRRSTILNRVRDDLVAHADAQEVAMAMKDQGLSRDDLSDDTKLLKLARALMGAENPQAADEFAALLESARGLYPQWNADPLVESFRDAVKPFRRKGSAYLAVTPVDIYANDYHFLFGWANSKGGIMSYRRFTAEFNDEVPDPDRLARRTLMQCLSSVGHIFKVERCTTPTCACAYPNSLREHDAKDGTLCAECREGFRTVFGRELPPPK